MAYEASDNSRYSEIIKEKLGLEREPVAVKFVKTEDKNRGGHSSGY